VINFVVVINLIALCQAWLLLVWVTVCWLYAINHTGQLSLLSLLGR